MKKYAAIPEEVELAISRKYSLKKGDFLYKAGQMPTALFVLDSGCIKNFYLMSFIKTIPIGTAYAIWDGYINIPLQLNYQREL